MTDAIDLITDRVRAQIDAEIAAVEARITRLAKAQKWADHPAHKYHDAIIAYYAPKIAAALKDMINGLPAVIRSAQNKYAAAQAKTAKAGSGEDVAAGETLAQQIARAAASGIGQSPAQLRTLLQSMAGDATLAGIRSAMTQIPGATVPENLADLYDAVDWGSWTPGNAAAADVLSSAGLQGMLDQIGATLDGITQTNVERIGNTLADGIAAGDSVQSIGGDISDMVGDDGRALIIANTETARAVSEASMSTYDANGITQYQWLAESDACPECSDNADNGPYDVGDDPDPSQPAHPNCFPAGTITAGAGVVGSVERWYSGELVEIVTAAGNFISVTPNHPILTENGWVAAGELNEGCHVVRCTDINGTLSTIAPHDYHGPALIENVAKSFCGSGSMATSTVPSSRIDFHGDGVDGQINVVRTNGLLRNGSDVVDCKHLGHGDLILANVNASNEFNSSGSQTLTCPRLSGAAHGIVGSLSQPQSLLGSGVGHTDVHGLASVARGNAVFQEPATDSVAVNVVNDRQSLFRFASEIPANNVIGRDGFSLVSDGDAAVVEFSDEACMGNPGGLQEFLDGLSGLVELDRIIHLNRVDFSGHVYNLQTINGWYFANGIVAHNCRCAYVPIVDTSTDNSENSDEVDSGGEGDGGDGE